MTERKDNSISVAILSFQDNTDIIGAKYVHAYLLAHGINSHLVLVPDTSDSANEALVAFLKNRRVLVIGLSLMTPEAPRAFSCASKIRAAMPEVMLVFGGIHATVDPEDCLQWGDATVRGEGEIAFLSIVRRIASQEDIVGVPGTAIRRDGYILESPPAPLVDHLDTLPFPRHLPIEMYVIHRGSVRPMDRLLFRKYARYAGRFLNITTTRGCPFACTYCCNSAYRRFYPRWEVRSRSVANVIEELVCEKTSHPNLITVNIQDDCFLSNSSDWLAEFAARYRVQVGIPFVIRTTPAHIKRENLLLLKQAGLVWIMVGLESGSNRVNKEVYRRHITKEQFLRSARIIHELGICPVYDVILDNPYETENDIIETLETVLSIPRPFQYELFSLRLFKGTELQERSIHDGINAVDPCVNYQEFSPSPLNRLIKMAAIYPPRLVRWLTSHRQQLLGRTIIKIISLISDLVLTPLSYLSLTHKAYGSRMSTTVSLFWCLTKTYLPRMLPKKPA